MLGQKPLPVETVKMQMFPSRYLLSVVHVRKAHTRPLFHGRSRSDFWEDVTILQESSRTRMYQGVRHLRLMFRLSLLKTVPRYTYQDGQQLKFRRVDGANGIFVRRWTCRCVQRRHHSLHPPTDMSMSSFEGHGEYFLQHNHVRRTIEPASRVYVYQRRSISDALE